MKGLRETDARYTETAVSAAEKAVDETERGCRSVMRVRFPGVLWPWFS